jgi:hypothetical protein
MFEHKDTVGHKAALKLFAEAKEKTLPNVCTKTLAHEQEITLKFFRQHAK